MALTIINLIKQDYNTSITALTLEQRKHNKCITSNYERADT